jgi:glutamate-1-semialdehyde 2,1-aminomutase
VLRRNQDLPSALQDAEEAYVRANPESLRLAEVARSTMPGGNTRTTLHYSPFPLAMRSGRGGTLTDVDGHSYVDFVNEHTAGVFGHSNPIIQEALRTAVADGIVLGAPNIYEHALAAEIQRRFDSMERLRFCNSGTEANLLAISTARAATGRPKVMAFEGAYHGSLLYFGHGASRLNMPFPMVMSVFNDADRAVADLTAEAGEIACLIVEPMQGAAGGLQPLPGFLEALRDACTRHGIVLIFDEVMTSRLGFSGMQGRLGIRPDMTTLGKYVGGGMTIGAFGGRADLMERLDPSRPGAIPHGGTFNNNVLAMAAGLAALTRVLDERASARMNELGDRLRQGLADAVARHDVPMIATGVGSIFGLHFHQGPLRNEADADAYEKPRAVAIMGLKKLFQLDLLARGQYVTRRILGNTSLETTEADIDGLMAAFEEFLEVRGELIRTALH